MPRGFLQSHGTQSTLVGARCPSYANCFFSRFHQRSNAELLPTPKAVKLRDAALKYEHRTSRRQQTASDASTVQPGVGPSMAVSRDPYDKARSHHLMSSIMSAGSWEQLSDLTQNYISLFNHIHLSALVCRLPKLVVPDRLATSEKARFNSFLRSISDMVSFRLPTFDPRALANVLWAVSKLGYSPAPPLLNKFLFEAYVRMFEFKGQELANLAWALATLAKMGNRPVPVWLRKFTQAAVLQVTYLKPQEVAHMAWALSKLFQPEDPPPSAAPSLTSTSAGVARSSGGPLQDSASGAASPPSASGPTDALPALAAALASRALDQLHRFRCGELVMTLVALYDLDPHAGAQLLRYALPHLLATHGSALSLQDEVQLWTVTGKCTAAGLLPEVLPRRCGGRPPLPLSRWTGIIDSAASVAQAGLGALESAGGLRTSHAAPGPFHEALPHARQEQRFSGAPQPTPAAEPRPSLSRGHLRLLLGLTERSLGQHSMEGLTNTLVAWARLDIPPDESLDRALFQRYKEVVPTQSTFQGVARTLWAAGHLGLRPDSEIMGWLLWCGGLQMATAKPQELVALLEGLLELGYRPGRVFFRRLSNRLDEVADEILPHGLHIVIKAYTVFGEPLSQGVRTAALEAATLMLWRVTPPERHGGEEEIGEEAGTEGQSGWAAEVARSVTVALGGRALGLRSRSAARRTGAGRAASGMAVPDSVATGAAAAPTAAAAAASAGPAPAPVRHIRLQVPSMSRVRGVAPGSVVRFLATLAGVGMPAVMGSHRRHFSDFSMQCLRWRIGRNVHRKRDIRNAIEASLWRRLGDLSNAALSSLVISLARLGIRPRNSFMQQLHEQLGRRKNTLEPWHAGALLAGISRIHSRLRPRSKLLHEVLMAMEPRFNQLRGFQLAGVLLSLARLGYRPPKAWMRSYFLACMARIDAWPEEGVSIFLRSLGRLGMQLRLGPCQRLQLVVRRTGLLSREAEAELRARGMGKERVRVLAGMPGALQWAEGRQLEEDLGRSLCRVCAELEECSL